MFSKQPDIMGNLYTLLGFAFLFSFINVKAAELLTFAGKRLLTVTSSCNQERRVSLFSYANFCFHFLTSLGQIWVANKSCWICNSIYISQKVFLLQAYEILSLHIYRWFIKHCVPVILARIRLYHTLFFTLGIYYSHVLVYIAEVEQESLQWKKYISGVYFKILVERSKSISKLH